MALLFGKLDDSLDISGSDQFTNNDAETIVKANAALSTSETDNLTYSATIGADGTFQATSFSAERILGKAESKTIVFSEFVRGGVN